jgi:L-fuconolactonase
LFRHLDGRDEPIVDPDLPIIDTHHHLFVRPGIRYLLEDYQADAGAGHDLRASVYVETRFMSRKEGIAWLRPIGEIEFANGMAAMAGSGDFGPCRVGAAIVGFGDLRWGAGLGDFLDRATTTAPDRFRGIRQIFTSHPDPRAFAHLPTLPEQDILRHPNLPDGLREIAKRGLLFEATILHNQLDDLTSLVTRFPDLTFVLSHMGLATCVNPTGDARDAVFRDWREKLRNLARRPNVICKIGGLGSTYWGFGFDQTNAPIRSQDLARAWEPYVTTAIEAFRADRCMMESNYPPDGRSCGFVPLWNALKLCVAQASADEKADLFHRTASRAYGISL